MLLFLYMNKNILKNVVFTNLFFIEILIELKDIVWFYVWSMNYKKKKIWKFKNYQIYTFLIEKMLGV